MPKDINPSKKSNRFILWILSVFTSVMILATVPFARPFQNYLKGRFGENIYIIFTIFFIIAGIEIFRRYILMSKQHRLRRIFAFVLIVAIYGYKLKQLHIAVERFHLIEYGLLAIFVTLASRSKSIGFLAYGWGLIATVIVGMGDEFFQWLWPDRYGEWRDVMINFQGGFLALFSMVLIGTTPDIHRIPSRKSLSHLFAGLAMISLISGAFFITVQHFGFKHSIEGIGEFRSKFQIDELKSLSNQLRKDKSPNFSSSDLDWYMREGKEHFDRSRFNYNRGHLDSALREYKIATTFYQSVLNAKKFAFPADMSTRLAQIPLDHDTRYESKIMDWIITGKTVYDIVFLTVMFMITFSSAALYLCLKNKSHTRKNP